MLIKGLIYGEVALFAWNNIIELIVSCNNPSITFIY